MLIRSIWSLYDSHFPYTMLIFFHNNNKIGKHGAHDTCTHFKWISVTAVAATDSYTLRMQSIETISNLCVEPQKFYPILASISSIFSHMVASWLL